MVFLNTIKYILAFKRSAASQRCGAAWGRGTPEGAADGGICLSTGRGTSWRRVLDRDQHIYDITIEREGRARALRHGL